jgi:hypothetical protein
MLHTSDRERRNSESLALRGEVFVEERAFDVLARQAASRRSSLLALGGAALAAAVSEPTRAKQKTKKQVRKKCRRQVAPCRSFFAGVCFGDPDCEAALFPCCDYLAQCDSGSMFECIFSCGCEELPELNVPK